MPGGQPCPGEPALPADAAPARLDGIETERLEIARVTALRLTSTGVRVSRRTLRDAGVRGSNAELGALARAVRSGGLPQAPTAWEGRSRKPPANSQNR